MTGTGLPGRQVTVTPEEFSLSSCPSPALFPPKQTEQQLQPPPCNDSTAAKFNIPWRMVRTRRQR